MMCTLFVKVGIEEYCCNVAETDVLEFRISGLICWSYSFTSKIVGKNLLKLLLVCKSKIMAYIRICSSLYFQKKKKKYMYLSFPV